MSAPQHSEFRPGHPFVWATALVAAAVFIAALVYVAVMSERHRVERIEAAEDKYGAEHVKKIQNGEGDGMWRLADGRTEVCRISGDTDDPTLRCGADLAEPAER